MSAAWVFPEIKPFQIQGRGMAEDNFAQEDRGNLEIMMREVLQNPLDAKSTDNDGPVKVFISIFREDEFDTSYLSKIVGSEYSDRLLAAGGGPLPEISKSLILVIEDFGTTGLEGNWKDQNADGSNENWNAFWFREGEGAKSAGGSNGRAGQGKITYYRAGAARLVLGLTVRKSDSASLLMGRSAFRRAYPFDGKKFQMQSFWCADRELPLPVIDIGEIKKFKTAFRLSRTTQPGLSLVIPFPSEFDPKIVVETIVSEFYYPIARGHLEVTVNNKSINGKNIDAIADDVLPDAAVRKKRSSFTKGYRSFIQNIIQTDKSGASPVVLKKDWDKLVTINENSFPEGSLTDLRNKIEKGDRISIRCPITVKPRNSNSIDTYFDVHLQVPEDLDKAEEAYIRRDLLIGSETHLASSTYLQNARALTLISTHELSAFLADAEEPTHLKWNASRPRLAEDYLNPSAAIRAVRQAAPRLMAVVSNGIMIRDTKALAKYFTRPSDEGQRRNSSGTDKGDKKTNPVVTPPVSVRKPFRIETETDSIKVLPNGSAGPVGTDLPMSCSLELAYEGLDQDPFKSYDPFDFDLNIQGSHPILSAGIIVTEITSNRILFDVTEQDFCIEIQGFDPNIRLKARLNFWEKDDGAHISDE